jgi:hypothetical protein
MGNWNNSPTPVDESWMIKYGWMIWYIHLVHGWKFQRMDETWIKKKHKHAIWQSTICLMFMKGKFNLWLRSQCKKFNMNILLPSSINIKCPNSIYHMSMWYMKDDKTTFVPSIIVIIPKLNLSLQQLSDFIDI